MLLHESIDFFAREKGDQLCIECGERRFDYRQALAHTNRLANALRSQGLGQGDRFAVLAKNYLEYPLVYFAGSKMWMTELAPVPPMFWDNAQRALST